MSDDEGLLRYLRPAPVTPPVRTRTSRSRKATCLGCGSRKPHKELNGPVFVNTWGESGRICRGCTARREWREGILRRMQEEQERLREMPLPPGVKIV